jgi:hypothetical protein
VIFLQDISHNRIHGSSRQTLASFQKLCGPTNLENVLLVTTMWGNMTEQTGSQHEQELCAFWKPLITAGAQVMCYHDTKKSAWDIIGKIRPGHYLRNDGQVKSQSFHWLRRNRLIPRF